MFGGIANWVGVVREPERIPEYVARAFTAARSGRPGRWCSGCRRTCCSAIGRRSPTPAGSAAGAGAVGRRDDAPQGQARQRRSARWCCSAAAAGARRRPRASQSSPKRSTCPSSAAFRRQDHLDNRHPRTSATPASTWIPSSRRRCAAPICCIVIGEGLGDVTTAGYTLDRAAEADAVPRARPSLGRRARARVPHRPADPRRAGSVRARARRLKPPAKRPLEPAAARPARRLRALAEADADAGRACASRR